MILYNVTFIPSFPDKERKEGGGVKLGLKKAQSPGSPGCFWLAAHMRLILPMISHETVDPNHTGTHGNIDAIHFSPVSVTQTRHCGVLVAV